MTRLDGSAPVRERLLEDGLAILKERGYHGTGIKTVLDRVAVPKGSFYNYFDSKEHFGVEVIRRFARQCNQRMDACFDAPGRDALSALREYVDQEIIWHEHQQFHGCLVGNLSAELGATNQACKEALETAYRGWQERFTRVLARAQEEGTVPEDVPASELGRVTFDAYEGALLRVKLSGSSAPLREFQELVLDRFLRV